MRTCIPVSTLWLTTSGPGERVVVAWAAWMVAVPALARLVAPGLGAGGVAMLAVLAGVVLAHRAPGPVECLRRHHLDDVEVTSFGPGRFVARLPWAGVVSCGQSRRAVVLGCEGGQLRLPLAGLVAAGAWGRVLARVVPERAHTLWTALDDGAVVLSPVTDPAWDALAAWCWLPAIAASLATGSPMAPAIATALIVVERAVVRVRRRVRSVVLQPGGLVVPGPRGRFFAPWDAIAVEQTRDGLRVLTPRGEGRVGADLADFWAAAAVIELRSQLGFAQPDLVHFRVQLDGDDIAVLGEIEAA